MKCAARPARGAAPGFFAIVLSLAAGWAGLSPAPAGAFVWEVHNNANNLAAVARAGGRVWCLSREGVHAYDPATGTFERHFRQPGGLVSNRGAAAAEDAAGNAWVGTDGGGAAFLTPDGRWFPITAQQGLPSDTVRVLEPLGERMWVGTKEGLVLFTGSEIAGAWPDGVNPSPFASNDVRALETFGARTWVGTTNGVYTTVDGLSWQAVNSGLGSTNLRGLAHDGTRLWALTANQQLWWGGDTGPWSAAPGVAGARALQAAGGDLYLAASSGVWRWNEGAQAWQALNGPDASGVDADGPSSVWASSATGLWQFNGTSWVNRRSPGPLGNRVQGTVVQPGRVYVTTQDRGTARYDDSGGWKNFPATAGTDTAFVSADFHFACLVDRDGYKWIGDWGASLARIDDSGPTPQFTHFFRHPPSDSLAYTWVWSSAHDPLGPRWFGLDTGCRGCGPAFDPRGLVRIDDDGTRNYFEPGTAIMSGGQVRTIAFAPNNAMWVGYADAGVDVYQDRNLQSRITHINVGPNGLVSPDVWSIVFEGGDAWILCSGSAVKVGLSGSSPTRLATLFVPSVSAEAVSPMTFDGNGALWMATTGGLVRRDPSGAVSFFTVSNSPLLSNDVRTVAFDPATGDLWVGTVIGLNRLRPDPPPSDARVADLPALIVSPNPQRISAIGSQFQVRAGNGEPLARTDLHLYDVRGRLVAVRRTDELGRFFWPPSDRSGKRLGIGVYFVRSFEFDGSGRLVASGNGRVVLGP